VLLSTSIMLLRMAVLKSLREEHRNTDTIR
jgi:hypothetical protein